MIFQWLGHYAVKLQTSGANSKTILINPYPKEVGLPSLALQRPDIVITYPSASTSEARRAGETKIPQGGILLDAPGEYEVHGMYIHGVRENGNTVYFIEADDMRILYLGEMSEPHMIPGIFSDLVKSPDVLFVPVGGDYTLGKERHKVLSADDAAKIVKQVSPKVVIPIHFKVPHLSLKLEGPEQFLKALGKSKVEAQDRVLLKPKDLTGKDKEVIVLKP